MKNQEVLQWLNKHKFFEKANNYKILFKKILEDCLNVNDEKILIISDTGYNDHKIAPIFCASYILACKALKKDYEIVMQTPKKIGDFADLDVIEKMEDLEKGSIILGSLSYKLGKIENLGGSYRKFIKKRNHRFTSTTSLGNISNNLLNKVIKSININFNILRKENLKLKKIFDEGNEIHIETNKGTDLYINIKGKKSISNDGYYHEKGTGGNIPVGEVYIPPRGKKKINGKLIIDGSIAYKDGSKIVNEEIELIIEKGKIVEINGGEDAKKLEKTFEWAEEKAKYPWGIRRLGEIGLGTNNNAEIIGATIVDEKVKGTAHIAFGSNHWFGGTIYAITHLDQVFKNPLFYIDDQLITTRKWY